MSVPSPTFLIVIAGAAALASALLICAAMPLLKRYALARPNARSSHKVPTPQGGGAPVILVTLAALLLVGVFISSEALPQFYQTLLVAAFLMAIVGAVDDIQTVPAGLRLLLQTLLVGAVVFSAPSGWRLTPEIPLVLERLLATVAGVWFVNLTNFMDGIDGMTVAEIVPVAAAVAAYAAFGESSLLGGVTSSALAGALLGFLVFNSPPARVFLGDVGSLPIGLIVAGLLYEAAMSAGLIAALILPLYYLFDATATLILRQRAGENLFIAHRRHAYQNAVDSGWSARQVGRWVLCLNLLLVALAALALSIPLHWQLLPLAVAVAATGFVCRTFRAAQR